MMSHLLAARFLCPCRGSEIGEAYHGLRCASPVATFRRPFGAKRECGGAGGVR